MTTRKRKEDEKANHHKELVGALTSIKEQLVALNTEVKRSRKLQKQAVDCCESIDETALDLFEKLEKVFPDVPLPTAGDSLKNHMEPQLPHPAASEESSASLPPTLLYAPFPMAPTEPWEK